MPDDDPLDFLLDHAGAELRREDAEKVARRISRAHPDEFFDALVRAEGIRWGDGQRPEGSFEIHDQDWWIDTADPGSHAHLLDVVVAAALADALRLELSTTWVARVLPAAVAVEAITHDPAGVHLRLRRKPVPGLPPHLANLVNAEDFREFTAAVLAAHETMPLPAGGTVTFTGP